MANLTVTGLDLGIFTIKAVVLQHGGKLPKLLSFGSVKTPQPGLISDNEIDLENVGGTIKSLLSSLKAPVNNVVVSLPESKIYSRVISDLPFLTDEEIGSGIKYSVEEFVPLPAESVELHWQVIARSKEKNQTMVLVIAVPKKVQVKYLKVLELAGIKPKAIETEMIAATRVLISSFVGVSTLVIQLGAGSTDLAVVANGVIILTRSITTGGLSLTRALAQNLNLQPLQAEEYKKVYGLLPDQLEGKIRQVLTPLIEIIATEAERTIQSYSAKNPNSGVKRLVLIGGGAKLPGLISYLANRLNLESQEADPWGGLEKDPSIASKLTVDPSYTVAVGLALRDE